MDFIPEWMLRPPPLSPYLTKMEYDTKFSFFGKIIDSYLTSKKGNTYEKYIEQTSHDPDPSLKNLKAYIEKVEAKKKNNNSK